MRLPKAKRILIWHLHLAKLLLVSGPESRVSVFLHGIEAWRRQDRLTRAALRRVHLFLSNSEFTWSRFIAFNPEFAEAAHRTVHLGLGSGVDGAAWFGAPPAILRGGRLR